MSEITEPQRAILQYASSHYGHLILVDDPEYSEAEKLYVSNLRSDYPFIINDDKMPQHKSLHVLKIGNLGYITIDKDYKIIKERTTSRDECIKHLDTFFDMWKRRAEEIIVAASADCLVKVTSFDHFFKPINGVLNTLWFHHSVHNAELEMDRSYAKRNRLLLYMQLLEDLKIVRKVPNGYDEGELSLFIRQNNTQNGYRNALLSCIIKEQYRTLRDVFRLNIFDRCVRIDSCIYLPEMEAEEPVYRKSESIRNDYKEYYNRRINPCDLLTILSELENAGAIMRDGQHYYGNEDLLKEMVKMKKKAPLISRNVMLKA
jgi:hypothetical protein